MLQLRRKLDIRRNHKRDINNFTKSKFKIIENNKNEHIEIFYNLLKKNLTKHNISPTHSFNELEWLFNNLSDDFKLTLIKNSKYYLAGSVKISINELTDYIIYGSMNYEVDSTGALKFLYWHTAKDSFSNKKKYLTFGINNKNHEEKNLITLLDKYLKIDKKIRICSFYISHFIKYTNISNILTQL